jgi:hypothetical protein
MGFDEDLKLGERAERFVVNQLREQYPSLRKVEGKNPDYDLIDDNGYTFEVKLDIKSKETQNIGIEYKHRGKKTAISTSKACEWIIIYYNHEWRYIRAKTENLRAFLRSNWNYLEKIKGKGDKSSLVLIPTIEMETYFTYREIDK